MLSNRVLNRTLLQRQLLLERSSMRPLEAVEYLVGLQAQLPLDPYYALWSRLDGFDPEELAGHVERREAVRVVVMRGTLHLVTAEDARAIWPRMEPIFVKLFGAQPARRDIAALPNDGFEAFRAEGRRLLAEGPKTAAQLAERMAERFPDTSLDGRRQMTYVIPAVQIPPRGVWGKTLQPTWADLERWLGKPLRKPIPLKTLVRRYLAAFGPASVSDFQNWSRLQAMRETFEGMRRELRTFRSESGRELFDLPDASIADADLPAPARLLPTYDNAVLGHDDRSRIVPSEQGKSAFINEDRNVGAVLVDGMVRGCWTVAATRQAATLGIEWLAPIGKRDRNALEREARALLAFAHPDATHEVTFREYTGPPKRG